MVGVERNKKKRTKTIDTDRTEDVTVRREYVPTVNLTTGTYILSFERTSLCPYEHMENA